VRYQLSGAFFGRFFRRELETATATGTGFGTGVAFVKIFYILVFKCGS